LEINAQRAKCIPNFYFTNSFFKWVTQNLLLVCKILLFEKEEKGKSRVEKKWYREDMRVALDIYDSKGCQWHIRMP